MFKLFPVVLNPSCPYHVFLVIRGSYFENRWPHSYQSVGKKLTEFILGARGIFSPPSPKYSYISGSSSPPLTYLLWSWAACRGWCANPTSRNSENNSLSIVGSQSVCRPWWLCRRTSRCERKKYMPILKPSTVTLVKSSAVKNNLNLCLKKSNLAGKQFLT